jgi:hypothetical protein
VSTITQIYAGVLTKFLIFYYNLEIWLNPKDKLDFAGRMWYHAQKQCPARSRIFPDNLGGMA